MPVVVLRLSHCICVAAGSCRARARCFSPALRKKIPSPKAPRWEGRREPASCHTLLRPCCKGLPPHRTLPLYWGVAPGDEAMKLLENSSFEAINSQLTVETGDAHIIGR